MTITADDIRCAADKAGPGMPQWRCAASTRDAGHASHLRSASSSAGAAAVVKLILLYKNIVYYAMHQHCRTVTPQRGKRMADEPIAGPLNCVEVPL